MLATSIDILLQPLLMQGGATRGALYTLLTTEVLQHHLQRMP